MLGGQILHKKGVSLSNVTIPSGINVFILYLNSKHPFTTKNVTTLVEYNGVFTVPDTETAKKMVCIELC